MQELKVSSNSSICATRDLLSTASMEEALGSREKLTEELHQIDRLRESSSTMQLSILPNLVIQEIQRLTDSIVAALKSLEPKMSWTEMRVPVPEQESMMSHMLAEYELSSAEATEKFNRTLNSELEKLMKSTEQFPATSEFIQKVMDYTETSLKKHRTVQKDYNAAREKRDRLRTERNMIRIRAKAKAVDPYYLLQLMDDEIDRLSDDIIDATLSMKMSNEVKISVREENILSRIPVEYGLSSAAETKKFIKKLRKDMNWVMSLAEKLPLSLMFIQRVIDYAERHLKEKRPSEITVVGRTTNNEIVEEFPARSSC